MSLNVDNSVRIDINNNANDLTPAKLTRKEKFRAFMQKVWAVVKPILIGLIGTALFAVNPTFFAIGFVVGVICPGTYIEDAVNRVILVWKKQSWVMAIATCVASFIALPVTIAAGSILFSAALGNAIRRKSEDALKAQQVQQGQQGVFA